MNDMYDVWLVYASLKQIYNRETETGWWIWGCQMLKWTHLLEKTLLHWWMMTVKFDNDENKNKNWKQLCISYYLLCDRIKYKNE